MKEAIKLFFKRLSCKHNYIVEKTILIRQDTKEKASTLECAKCGKHRIDIHY